MKTKIVVNLSIADHDIEIIEDSHGKFGYVIDGFVEHLSAFPTAEWAIEAGLNAANHFDDLFKSDDIELEFDDIDLELNFDF